MTSTKNIFVIYIFYYTCIYNWGCRGHSIHTTGQSNDFWLSRFYNGTTPSRTAASGVVPSQFKENAKTPKTFIYPVQYIPLYRSLHLHFCFSEVMVNFYVPLHTKHTQLSSSNLDQRNEASPCQYMRFSIIQNWQKSQVPSACHDI